MTPAIEKRFIEFIKKQLGGLALKVSNDFSKTNFDNELAGLSSDPVYEKFGFNVPEYVLVRFMGRISISIGRRLGEIYDKVPRLAAAARFNLTPIQIAPKFEGLELDISLKLDLLNDADKEHVRVVVRKYLNTELNAGIGIEIRYNFNPNDSSRLRKDVVMGSLLETEGLKPVYLVFSAISPRQDAISRLTNGGWQFLTGANAISFISELLEMDIQTILDKPAVKSEISKEVASIMSGLLNSYAFKYVLRKDQDIIS